MQRKRMGPVCAMSLNTGAFAQGLGTCLVALARWCSDLACSLLQYIFVDAYAQYLWITFDFCSTIHGFSIPFRAADLLLHSKASNLLLGFDRSHPNKQVRDLWSTDISKCVYVCVWCVLEFSALLGWICVSFS